MRTHALDPHAQMHAPHHWRDDGTCSFCGSLTVAEATRLLTTLGTHYSGSDWKYGWPHKFYIGHGKFYAEHLMDATPEQLAAFNVVAEPTIGITYFLQDGQLGYRTPHRGFQTWGTVGDGSRL